MPIQEVVMIIIHQLRINRIRSGINSEIKVYDDAFEIDKDYAQKLRKKLMFLLKLLTVKIAFN